MSDNLGYEKGNSSYSHYCKFDFSIQNVAVLYKNDVALESLVALEPLESAKR